MCGWLFKSKFVTSEEEPNPEHLTIRAKRRDEPSLNLLESSERSSTSGGAPNPAALVQVDILDLS